jgi:predicted choloylglycine hydrolase
MTLKRFVFEREDRPGAAWAARFLAGRHEAESWYLGERRRDAPTAVQCRAALKTHMPELLPRYDEACDRIGDDEMGPSTRPQL